MPTIGEFLAETMRETGPGVKGTPSAMTPETIGKKLLTAPEETIRPEQPGWLPSWARGVTSVAAAALPTIGAWLAGRKGKRLFTEPAKVATRPYRERAGRIVQDLQGRGYDKEDIQKVLEILARAYGEEPANVEEFKVY